MSVDDQVDGAARSIAACLSPRMLSALRGVAECSHGCAIKTGTAKALVARKLAEIRGPATMAAGVAMRLTPWGARVALEAFRMELAERPDSGLIKREIAKLESRLAAGESK